MQHLIFGSGLIGSYLAAVLSVNGEAVRVVARGDWLARLRAPLVAQDYLGNRAALELNDVQDEQSARQAGPVDVLWLTVKCTAVADIAEDIKHYIKPETIIVCCQNGLDSDVAIRACYPNQPILRAMVPFNVVHLEPNTLHKGSEGKMVIEQGSAAVAQCLADGLQHPLLEVAVADDMTAVLWSKLQLNLGNSVNALANVPVKQMLSDRGYRKVIAAMMRELLSVTRAKQITMVQIGRLPAHRIPSVLNLPNFLFTFLAKKMLAIDPNVRTSMWWDIEYGKATEIDFLNGAVVKAANELGIACPANQAIVELIRQTEKKRLNGEPRTSFTSSQLIGEIAQKKRY